MAQGNDGGGGNGEDASGLGGSAITGASGVRSAGRRLQSKLKPESGAAPVRAVTNSTVSCRDQQNVHRSQVTPVHRCLHTSAEARLPCTSRAHLRWFIRP